LRPAEFFAELLAVLFDLEIEHPHGDEVRAALERVCEAVARVEGAGGQDFECEPGL
jgi:hypothetical protein